MSGFIAAIARGITTFSSIVAFVMIAEGGVEYATFMFVIATFFLVLAIDLERSER